eukprot:1706900-Alexandrium_andersonii.AAC.1
MSASLVGSEMCIRDRPYWPPCWWTERALEGMQQQLRQMQLQIQLQEQNCLLYTSDAADDM